MYSPAQSFLFRRIKSHFLKNTVILIIKTEVSRTQVWEPLSHCVQGNTYLSLYFRDPVFTRNCSGQCAFSSPQCCIIKNSAYSSKNGWEVNTWFHQQMMTLLSKVKQTLIGYRCDNFSCRSCATALFHFSWVYTFSAMLSSLRNRANHDRYRLRPSTPAQLCWSSSRL